MSKNSNSGGFMETLAGMIDAARDTELSTGGGGPPLPGGKKFNLQILGHEAEDDENDYGPFVKARVKFMCLDPGEYEGREFDQTYFINLTKDGKLSYGGQSYVQLANVCAQSEIEGNNPAEAAQVLDQSTGSVVLVKTWTDKKGYLRLDPISLESGGTATEEDDGGDTEEEEVPAAAPPAKKGRGKGK